MEHLTVPKKSSSKYEAGFFYRRLFHKGIHISIRNNRHIHDVFSCITVLIYMENQEYKLYH